MNLWLSQLGFSTKTIGQLAFVQLPYTLRFLWAPLIERHHLPFLKNILGKKRSWLLIAQLGLIFSISSLGLIDPQKNLNLFAMVAFLTSFFSATQDLVLGGYRIEILSVTQQGPGAGAMWIGYRMGLLVSSSGAFYCSSFFSWSVIYQILACVMVLGLLVVFLNPEPQEKKALSDTKESYFSIVSEVVKGLLKNEKWFLIAVFIIFYKVGDGIFGAYTPIFLSKLGFSNIDIAYGSLMGALFSIIGGLIGGILVSKFGAIQALKYCAYLQIATCISLICQYKIGFHKGMMFTVMGFENFYFGLGGAAFYSFLSLLCNSHHTATQFALLCSFGSFSRIFSTWMGGRAADLFTWDVFFFLTSLAGVFYVFLLKRMSYLSISTRVQ